MFFKNIISNTIPYRYHIIFWVIYFVFNVVRWGSYFNDFLYSFKSNLVEFPIHILAVYINIYYLIPKFILRKKYWSYIGYVILILVLVYLVRTGLNYLLVTKEIWPEAEDSSRFLKFNHVVAVILGELYVIGFVTAIKLVVDWSIEKRMNEDLAKLQLNTELKYLKAQIEPHFFFNTLNNLYALINLNKSDKASSVVIKLSEMMQYVLYEVNNPKVSLLQEIKHIDNYIDIQKIKFIDKIESELKITGEIEDVLVPPLLFLSFVENCFKHGLKENDTIFIHMSFKVIDKTYLKFFIKNNFNPHANKNNKQGIGINNAKRRLNLLFSTNFKLVSKIKKDIYTLNLKIPIQ